MADKKVNTPKLRTGQTELRTSATININIYDTNNMFRFY